MISSQSKNPEVNKQDLLMGLKGVRQQILDAARSLPPGSQDKIYLGTWDVKDMLAHLEGWDFANLQAIGEVLSGRLPGFYGQIDRGWIRFNARLVALYRKEDLFELISDVEDSHRMMIEALNQTPALELERDHGVRYKGWKVTVTRLLRAELSDETEHLAQLKAFARTVSGWEGES